MSPINNEEERKLISLMKEYRYYKDNFVKDINFDPSRQYLSMKFILINFYNFSPDSTVESSPLQVFKIYFDTATYDEIQRDVKVTVNAQLGFIGGTMGLLTGYSILSGVELIFFICKFLYGFQR